MAQEMSVTGHGIGMGLKAEAMMRGVSPTNLDRMAQGLNPVIAVKPSKRWCYACSKAGVDPWQEVGHYHA